MATSVEGPVLEPRSAGQWQVANATTQDWDKKDFQVDSLDYAKKGSLLADGWSGVAFVLRSDLEFLHLHFPCSLCKADRPMDCPWTDCRTCAAWRATTSKPNEWLAQHPTCHAFFHMEGSGLDLVFPDLMHTKHLGTDQLLIGGALTWLVKHFVPGSASENLSVVWDFIQRWYKDS